MKNKSGVTLVELLFVMAIFSIVMAGLYSSYQVQLKSTRKEFRMAESGMEGDIASSIIERDLCMAGYGLADNYKSTTLSPLPRSVSATNDNPDTLTLMGTALGMEPRAAQAWSQATGTSAFLQWDDARENLRTSASGNDVVILMEPTSKTLLTEPTNTTFLFQFKGFTSKPTSLPGNVAYNIVAGTVAYGLYTDGTGTASLPYSAVRYYLGGTSPTSCAPGTLSLLRAESRTTATPGSGQPLLNCVLDFQVAFGLDTDESGSIDSWDNGGVTAATYVGDSGPLVLNRRLKQIRLYALVQVGAFDSDYTFSNPYPPTAQPTADWVRVGEMGLTGGATGRDVQLTAAQRKYVWKVLIYVVTPKNVR